MQATYRKCLKLVWGKRRDSLNFFSWLNLNCSYMGWSSWRQPCCSHLTISPPKKKYLTGCCVDMQVVGWKSVMEGVVRWGCGGQLCHTYELASASWNRQRGVEAITALAIQHNGLLSPHHQSLSQSTPPTHTLLSNTHIQVCTNKCLRAR